MSMLINPRPITFTSNLFTMFMPSKIARSPLGRAVYVAAGHLPEDLADELVDALSRSLWIESELRLQHVSDGRTYDLGVVSRKVITNAGVAAVVGAFRGTFTLSTFNYHGLGIGAGGEAATDTALVTELTTQYSTDNTRPAGTQSAPGANQYQSVATITVDAAASITEHGIFSQTAAPGGTLWDRSSFGALALASGDAIIATYIATITAGG